MTLNRNIQPAITPFGELNMPMPLVQTLANGAKLYIINKGDQEVCRIDILFEGGRYAASTPTIADITGPMLRKGIPGMDQEAIAEHLDYHGAWLQSGTTQHYSTLSLFSLNRNLEKVLPTMAAMITSPTLPEKPFDTLRQQRIQQLAINREKVSIRAAEAFNSLIFGEKHPYARTTTDTLLSQTTLDDIRYYHQQYYLNTHIDIILSGCITPHIINLVEQHLGSIPTQQDADYIHPQPITPQQQHTALVDKPGSLQSGIRIGLPLIGSEHPDYPALTLVNLILGGYFGSRLMTNIREEKGYTYGISSHIISMRHSAYLTIVTETGTQYTQPLIDEVKREVETITSQLIDDDELETARNYLQGRRARALDSPFAMADYFVSSIIANNPLQYFNTEDNIIRNTTPQDLLRVAQTHINPHNLYFAIAGDKSKIYDI